MFEDYYDGYYEDDYADDDLSKLAKSNSKSLAEIEKIIKDNYDANEKTIGDRVLVWDCSRLTDDKTSEFETNPKIHMILANYPSIVIHDRQRYNSTLTTMVGDFTVNLDLKVWNKKLNKVYRTSSEFVKIV